MSSPHYSTIIILIGIPGSGKSRWATKYQKRHNNIHIVSTDQIRKELTGCEQCIDPSQNGMIHDEARKRVKAIMDDPNNYGGNHGMGPEIIVDSTNVDWQEWAKYRALNPTAMLALPFNVDVDTAMDNQRHRERQVPREILEMKWKQMQENKHLFPRYFDMIIDKSWRKYYH